MNRPVGGLLVIGMGNVLLGDDGVGVRVVEALGRIGEQDPGALPPGTRLLDGGTLGLRLLVHLDGAQGLVIVDAVDLGTSPGTVTVLRGAAMTAPGGPRGGSNPGGSNPGGLAELLGTAGLLGILPPKVALVGVQVAEIGIGLTLSPEVAAAVPAAIDAARHELHQLEASALARGSGWTSRTAHVAGATA